MNRKAKKPKRSSNERPTDYAQAGDSFSQQKRIKALLELAKFNDAATVIRPENAAFMAPRVMVVAFILDQVQPSSVNGGRRSGCDVKRARPELTVLADCKKDIKDVMNAAKAVFGKESSQDKKDLYESNILVRGSNEKLLSATVKRYVNEEKAKRKGVTTKPPAMKGIQSSFPENIVHEY